MDSAPFEREGKIDRVGSKLNFIPAVAWYRGVAELRGGIIKRRK